MKQRILLPLALALAVACGDATRTGEGDWGGQKSKDREEFILPVRVAKPGRETVVDTVETQASLESERVTMIYTEMEGKIARKVRDLGDPVGVDGDGDDPFLLATLDDRRLKLALQDANAKLKEVKGRVGELTLEHKRALREVAQARVELAEAESVRRRTKSGREDGTISLEEDEKATFAETLARSKVETALAAVEKAALASELAAMAIEPAEVAVARAELDLEHTRLRAPHKGVVAICDVREGEMIKAGTVAYKIVDPDALILYAEIPVRQALRVRPGNDVFVGSTAVPGATKGKVKIISPTVNKDSGMVRIKVAVDTAPGYSDGLYVDVRIVVAERKNALVVPKRAVLHDDEEGAYLYVVEENRARRVLVAVGFQNDDAIEITQGIDETSQIVVEGQDTLTHGAKVALK